MSDEQRAGLAIVLMVIVLLIWARFFKSSPPPAPKKEQPVAAEQQPAPAANLPPASAAAKSVKHSGAKAAPARKTAATATPTIQAGNEQTVTITSGLYRVELSNRGGVVHSWKLEKYRNNETPPKPLELVDSAAAKALNAWPLSIRLDDPKLDSEANSALYEVKSSQSVVNAPATTLGAPAEVDFSWSDGHLAVNKQLRFGTGYEMEMSVSATLDGRPLVPAIAWRGGFGDQSAYNAGVVTEVFWDENGKFETLNYKKVGVKGHQDQAVQVSGTTQAAGIEDTFFTAAFLSNQPNLTLWNWMQEHSVTENGKTAQKPVTQMAVAPQSAGPWNVRLYVGPKELSELGMLQPKLTDLVQFGYMSIIAKPLLSILKWIYRYVPNYGWAIVLLTIAINMALFPFKAKSWRSMKKMQDVAPKMKAIQAKYKKYSMRDPRRKQMQEEIGALYKEHGVNPLGSCLPQVVQFPIWWALYRMLEYSIELRHAPWIGWIHDLSARDPYYILPILMTIAMYYMTKMTPQTVTDPAQQKMMTLMPLAFGVFLFLYSSGLVLYIFTSSVVGIGQQWFLNRTDPLPSRSRFKKKTGDAAKPLPSGKESVKK